MLIWLSSFLTNPIMLLAGSLAVLSPIIIHLLNKRRFKIVDWAAMDFLFDADKKNRRRVRLENFILLLLRCLAMLLLGLLLAKPFLPSGTFGQSQQYQRVIVLDDSLSQRIKIGSQTAFGKSLDQIKQLLQRLATNGGNDFLTLYLTSESEKPYFASEPVTQESLDVIIGRLEELECSDEVANYPAVLAEVNALLESDRTDHNQVVYVMSDLRKRDWQLTNPDDENSPNKLVEKISEITPNTFIVDVGSTIEDNLAVTGVKAEDLLVSGTIVRFSVEVSNFGDSTASEVGLRFRVDDSLPQTETIASIAPGKTETITFRHLFQHDTQEFQSLDSEDRLQSNLTNSRVKVELIPQSSMPDALAEDSEGFFAARTLKKIPVLIVDGDPSANPERSDAYYLSALEVPGTGILVDTATVGELETISLTKYKVIFLCNVDEASADRLKSLSKWVENGGGLVFMPGDRVRAATFNESFYKDGSGLSPLKLEAMEGDLTRGSWIYMETKDSNHPALRVVLDPEIGFDNCEIFSWWRGSVKPDQDGKVVATPLLLGNQDKTPAMADRTFGKGRTVTFAFSADADWTFWPSDPTYIPVMWELVNDMVGGSSEAARYRVGGDLRQLVDISQYQLRVGLTDPAEEKVDANAKPLDGGGEDIVLYEVEFPNLSKRGFYDLELRYRPDGDALSQARSEDEETVGRLFAVNTDPAESDLRRLDLDALPNEFFGEATSLVDGEGMVTEDGTQSTNDVWLQILFLLAGMLVLEQFLGWWFGRSR